MSDVEHNYDQKSRLSTVDIILRFDKWYVNCATLGFIGRIPKAPGTFGSIPGLFLGVIAYYIFRLYGPENTIWSTYPLALALSSIVLLTLFSWIIIALTEKYWGLHDRSEIVIDELAGQYIPIVFVGGELKTLVISFIVFRILDILKPWPINHIDENWPGALGTLFDDIVAGVLTAIFILLARPLWL